MVGEEVSLEHNISAKKTPEIIRLFCKTPRHTMFPWVDNIRETNPGTSYEKDLFHTQKRTLFIVTHSKLIPSVKKEPLLLTRTE